MITRTGGKFAINAAAVDRLVLRAEARAMALQPRAFVKSVGLEKIAMF